MLVAYVALLVLICFGCDLNDSIGLPVSLSNKVQVAARDKRNLWCNAAHQGTNYDLGCMSVSQPGMDATVQYLKVRLWP